ncbi:hypothetical protein DSM43518_04029 [Mycobacterium marinum]|nr:hypothetical protein DSM43518_04029 [Mycobacterium marinum]RFZ17962.1 hypothetical protein DSM44344_05257 [Mycobacterium marinum]RFZ33100.1 hypothetical protein NCTC2275_02879 [Mycobacterium marinum]
MLGLGEVAGPIGLRRVAPPTAVGTKGCELGADAVEYRPTAVQAVPLVGEPESK